MRTSIVPSLGRCLAVATLLAGATIVAGSPSAYAAEGGTFSMKLLCGTNGAPTGQVTVEIETERPTAVIAALTEWAALQGVDELPALSVARPTLEDTYLKLIGEQERVDA